MTENYLELQNVKKSFSNFTLEDISFTLPKGYIMGLIGSNGAGKTTTIRQLMGFLAPDSGTCTINGLDCRTQTAAIQKIWAMCIQENVYAKLLLN